MFRRTFLGLFTCLVAFAKPCTFENFELLGMDYTEHDYYRDTCDLKLLLNHRVYSIFHEDNQRVLVTIPGLTRLRWYNTSWLRSIKEGSIIHREQLEEFSFDVKKI